MLFGGVVIQLTHSPEPWPHVTKYKPIAFNDLCDLDVDGRRESRAAKNEGMEFAALAARIDIRWKVCEQTSVKEPACKRCGYAGRINTGHHRLHT
jgi:hypothetical protein